jgi:hypothetical protein
MKKIFTMIFGAAVLLALVITAQRGVLNLSDNGTAATSTPTSTLPYDSGIRGTVTLSPVCPVERIPPNPNCAPKPYQTLVAVFRAGDAVHAIAFGRSDASGIFSFSLPPGDYVLGAGESNLPRCDHPSVTVLPGVYASVSVSCDTGIR